MAKLSALGYFGLGKETTFGTAVGPTYYIPYDSVKVEDEIKKISDEGRRGVLVKDFEIYNTTREAKVEFDGPCYADSVGMMLLGLFGTKTTTGVGPYTHTFKVNAANAPSFTAQDYNAMTERKYAGAIVEEVGFKFDSDQFLKVSTKMKSKASATVTKTTPTVTVAQPFMGFTATLKINGVANTNMLGGEVTFKREADLIYAGNNTQDPSKYITGRMEASGKLTFDVEDETEFLYYTNGTKPSISIKLEIDTNTTIEFLFTKVDISKANVDRGSEFVRVDLDFKGIYNATDAGVAQVVLKNAVATY